MTAANDNATGIGSDGEGSAAREYRTPGSPRPPVPPAAKWLGASGAVPFVFLAAAGVLVEGRSGDLASFALIAYGALILSFLGGVHWGLAIAESGPESGGHQLLRRLAISVVPALIGWGALLLPKLAGLMVLSAAFALLLLFDAHATRKAEAPDWYPRLRWPLTLVVVISLFVGAFA